MSALLVMTSTQTAETSASLRSGGPVGLATTVDGPDRHDVVTINVPIDLVPGSPELVRPTRKLARVWEQQAETSWNNAFEFFEYRCFKFHVDVDIKVRREGFAGSADRHRVLVGEKGGGTPGYDGSNAVNPKTGLRDGTLSYDHPRDGIFREDQPESATVHEVGHLMGLGDDYVVVTDPRTGRPVEPRQTTPKQGRGGTLMGDGGVIDPALVDRIGKQIEKLLDGLPGCETWEGTFTGTEIAGECMDNVQGTLNLQVASSGRVTGTGQRTDTYVDCSDAGTATTAVTVSGQATDRAFELYGFTQVEGGPFPVPKSGTRARRNSFVTTQDQKHVYSIDLRCVSCVKPRGR